MCVARLSPNGLFWRVYKYRMYKIRRYRGEKGKLLTESLEVSVSFYNDSPISVDLPNQVTCKIETTDAAIKGQTASSSRSPPVV